MESEDYSFYQGLVFLLENDVQDLGYELTFSTDVSIVVFHSIFSISHWTKTSLLDISSWNEPSQVLRVSD
jgi:hypothetical protein